MKIKKIYQICCIILAISVLLTFSGCLESKPESVLDDELKYAENKEYDKMLNLYVKPDTLKPYTDAEKTQIIKLMTLMEGSLPVVKEFKVLNKTKISDDKYIVTTQVKYTGGTLGGTTGGDTGQVREEIKNRTIVKVNGEWKIAEKIPGFESLFAILTIFGGYYIVKKRRMDKKF